LFISLFPVGQDPLRVSPRPSVADSFLSAFRGESAGGMVARHSASGSAGRKKSRLCADARAFYDPRLSLGTSFMRHRCPCYAVVSSASLQISANSILDYWLL